MESFQELVIYFSLIIVPILFIGSFIYYWLKKKTMNAITYLSLFIPYTIFFAIVYSSQEFQVNGYLTVLFYTFLIFGSFKSFSVDKLVKNKKYYPIYNYLPLLSLVALGIAILLIKSQNFTFAFNLIGVSVSFYLISLLAYHSLLTIFQKKLIADYELDKYLVFRKII